VVINYLNEICLLLLQLDDLLLNLFALDLGDAQLVSDVVNLNILLLNLLEFALEVHLLGLEVLAQLVIVLLDIIEHFLFLGQLLLFFLLVLGQMGDSFLDRREFLGHLLQFLNLLSETTLLLSLLHELLSLLLLLILNLMESLLTVGQVLLKLSDCELLIINQRPCFVQLLLELIFFFGLLSDHIGHLLFLIFELLSQRINLGLHFSAKSDLGFLCLFDEFV